MGCCQSTFDREGKSRNDQIDDQIRRDKVNLKNEIKMLLLGKTLPLWINTHVLFIDTHPPTYPLCLQALESPENPQS